MDSLLQTTIWVQDVDALDARFVEMMGALIFLDPKKICGGYLRPYFHDYSLVEAYIINSDIVDNSRDVIIRRSDGVVFPRKLSESTESNMLLWRCDTSNPWEFLL